MMRKILVPTDFSENSMNALRYAVELFKYERSDFFVMHTYADEVYNHETLSSRETFDELKRITEEKSNDELAKILNALQEVSPNPRHQYHTLSLFGHLVDECNDIVDKENIDIIVMGTRGKTDDRKLTFGSNTLQVMKYVKSPVLSVPNDCSYQQPKKIVFPTDFQLPYKRRELKLLNTLAHSFRSQIDFLYISDYEKLSIRQEDNKVFLEESLEGVDLVFHTHPGKDLTKTINEYIAHNNVDFLVMVNSRHSYLECVLYQSTIDKIGLHIKIPFLVMQNLQRN